METVYIVLIAAVAVVVLVTIILLRNRITKAKLDLSIKDQKASLELNAAKSQNAPTLNGDAQRKRSSRRGIIGNVAEWWSSIRIRTTKSAAVENNKAAFGSDIEIVETPEVPSKKPPKKS